QRLGGEYAMTPYAMTYLEASLTELESVTSRRSMLWERYQKAFKKSMPQVLEEADSHGIILPSKITHARGNAHIYYLIMPDTQSREGLRLYLKERNIDAYTHYEPLHLSEGGKRYGKTRKSLSNTEAIAQRMLRLPLYDALSIEEQDRVIEAVINYVIRS
ncbi:MAG TPA: DegT/DnrJ/EryC1/StrS family aminotransferase, partial [Fusibacter sp.]|nr:DegT/DnrJ/EryC1/StrS family aminotransferase [Fusibacter sp.]